jgi:hypothetical protein
MLLTAIVSHRNLRWHGIISPFAEQAKPPRILLSGYRFAANFCAGVGRRAADYFHLVKTNA